MERKAAMSSPIWHTVIMRTVGSASARLNHPPFFRTSQIPKMTKKEK
jgi:hypothetical protein